MNAPLLIETVFQLKKIMPKGAPENITVKL